MKTSILLFLLSTGIANANISPAGFEEFPNYYFVETGTYDGLGIRYALRAKFPKIYSMELIKNNVDNVAKMFKENSNVHVVQGDSGKHLYQLIKGLDKPITFWLDAHSGVDNPNQKNTPILEELEQIKWHHIKTHTILIDDMHCCGTGLFDYLTQDQIEAKVMEINPEYEIRYIPGGNDAEYPVNVMVAQVPSKK